MFRIGLFLVALLAPVAAFAQPSPTKLHVDVLFVNNEVYPVDADSSWRPITVPAGQAIVIAGWMLNCYTGQQPPWVTVFDNSAMNPANIQIMPRIERPDVQAAAGDICGMQPQYAVHLPSGPYLGFGVMVPPLTPGRHNLLLRVTDVVAWPTTDTLLGTQYKTIALFVQ